MTGAGSSPKKRSENRQKQERLTVRFSPAEREQVEALAERAGLTLGSYVRSRCLEKPTTRAVRRPTVQVQALNAMLRELSKQGTNLNQLTKKANAGNMPLLAEIRTTFEANRRLAEAIWERMEGNI